MEQATFVVPDMTCSHCVMHVTKAISEQPGTADVHVDRLAERSRRSLESKRATFKYDPAQATLEAIAGAIAKAGYTTQQP